MKNRGNRNNILYVVFYELSDDKSYFSNKRAYKFANFNSIWFYSKIEDKRVDRNSHEKIGRPTFRVVILDIQRTI